MRKDWIVSRSLILFVIATAFLYVHAESTPSSFVPDRKPVCRGFAPENDEWIPEINSLAAQVRPGITHGQFDEILDRIVKEYGTEVQRRGGILRIERKWSNGKVNAYAYRDDDRHWIISMFGGMARHPFMNYDGFASVACHEMGHHFGGLPKYTGDDWAAVEGEADYYATLKCLRRLFAKDDNKRLMANREVDPEITARCAREHRGQQDQLICARVGQAGLDMGGVLARLEKADLPHVTPGDPRRVARTIEGHPRAQCRVDTYVNGALCTANPLDAMSDRDAYRAACATSTPGERPRCWYKP